MQSLSVDFSKAGEALRLWAAGEGDELRDILGASATILAHFSAALSGYALREHTIRDHLKAIRAREQALNELKQKRKAAHADADSAERRLNKMGRQHKNLSAQIAQHTQQLAKVREMDGQILSEEAALGDFKRSSVRALIGLKFGGLMECCEKGRVVAELGAISFRRSRRSQLNRVWHARSTWGTNARSSASLRQSAAWGRSYSRPWRGRPTPTPRRGLNFLQGRSARITRGWVASSQTRGPAA
ncbi:hypothetical protein B0H17DRAFT_513143 [Mycena rosella]|uniref:Uncharacterized protein n=1 Tax=Mycena rosella TaxID=1033263 RepID=A0AAD7DJS4_MYCRO|nr:hypothetical protein B0H17DRAFT_513143 [Mycena rosella]